MKSCSLQIDSPLILKWQIREGQTSIYSTIFEQELCVNRNLEKPMNNIFFKNSRQNINFQPYRRLEVINNC